MKVICMHSGIHASCQLSDTCKQMVVKLNGAPCEDWLFGIIFFFFFFVPVMEKDVMPYDASGLGEVNPVDR